MSDRQGVAFLLAAVVALVLWANNSLSSKTNPGGGIRTKLDDVIDAIKGVDSSAPVSTSPASGGVNPVLLPSRSSGGIANTLPPVGAGESLNNALRGMTIEQIDQFVKKNSKR